MCINMINIVIFDGGINMIRRQNTEFKFSSYFLKCTLGDDIKIALMIV